MSVFSGMLSLIYLAEISYFDTSEKKLYVGTHGYTTEPSDTLKNKFFEPWIESPMLYSMNAWTADGNTSRSGHGELRLINTEGQLNFLADCALDGREFRMMCAYENDTYTSFRANTIMSGTMLNPQWEDDIVVIQLRDKTALFDRPIQQMLYAGNNVLPNGVEGVEDIKGTRKPFLLGKVFNISPINVNSSLLIYQVSSDPIYEVTDVYAGGIALNQAAPYLSLADMQTNAPNSGYFRVWKEGGCFRLGSDPVNQVTCDAAEGALSTRSPAQLIKKAAIKGGLDGGLINEETIAGLDEDAPYECGIWVNGDDTAMSVIDSLSAGGGAWWTFDATGKLCMGQLKNPDYSSPVTTLTHIEILDTMGIERVSTGDGPDGLPPHQIIIKYQKNYTLQSSGLFGNVTQARKNWLDSEWRTITTTNANIKTKHLLSGAMERQTPITKQEYAQAEADRMQSLRCARRDTIRITIQVGPDIQTLMAIGAVISLQYPRYGYDSGRNMVITGIEHDARIGLFTLTLWG